MMAAPPEERVGGGVAGGGKPQQLRADERAVYMSMRLKKQGVIGHFEACPGANGHGRGARVAGLTLKSADVCPDFGYAASRASLINCASRPNQRDARARSDRCSHCARISTEGAPARASTLSRSISIWSARALAPKLSERESASVSSA